MFQFSQSMAKTRRKCHAAYDFRYNQFLKKKAPKLQLLRGTILDEMLTARAKKKKRKNEPYLVLDQYAKTYASLLREEQEYYGDLIGDIRRIFEGYEREYADDGLTYIGSQIEVTHPFKELGVEAIIHIDKVVKDRQGNRWIMDHKSHKSIPSADQRFADIQ